MTRESAPPTDDSLVASAFAEAGLAAWAPVPGPALAAGLEGLPAAVLSRYGLDRGKRAWAVALAYGEGPAAPPAWAAAWLAARPGPLATIGRFARANWYAELVSRLKRAAASIRAGLGARGLEPGAPGEWRCLANSGLPEKRLALAAGLGGLGRHGLVMLPGAGPACVLGLLLAPAGAGAEASAVAPSGAREPPRPGTDPACEGCGECLFACPTGALGPAGYSRELCIQHWSTLPGPLPPEIEAAWGPRLYGCDACLEACPRFRPDPGAVSTLGPLGPGLPAEWLLEASDEELRSRLRGTALGLGWMPLEAFRRNARLALRARGGS